MFLKKNKIDLGPLLVILTIFIIIFFSIFSYFKFNEKNNLKIPSQIITPEEIKKTEVDIAEIERRLDELDINLDDLLKELEF